MTTHKKLDPLVRVSGAGPLDKDSTSTTSVRVTLESYANRQADDRHFEIVDYAPEAIAALRRVLDIVDERRSRGKAALHETTLRQIETAIQTALEKTS